MTIPRKSFKPLRNRKSNSDEKTDSEEPEEEGSEESEDHHVLEHPQQLDLKLQTILNNISN